VKILVVNWIEKGKARWKPDLLSFLLPAEFQNKGNRAYPDWFVHQQESAIKAKNILFLKTLKASSYK